MFFLEGHLLPWPDSLVPWSRHIGMISSAGGLEFIVPAEGIVSLFLTQGVTRLPPPPSSSAVPYRFSVK